MAGAVDSHKLKGFLMYNKNQFYREVSYIQDEDNKDKQ